MRGEAHAPEEAGAKRDPHLELRAIKRRSLNLNRHSCFDSTRSVMLQQHIAGPEI